MLERAPGDVSSATPRSSIEASSIRSRGHLAGRRQRRPGGRRHLRTRRPVAAVRGARRAARSSCSTRAPSARPTRRSTTRSRAGRSSRPRRTGWSTSRRPRARRPTPWCPTSRSRSRSRPTAARPGSSSCARASSSRTARSLKPSDVARDLPAHLQGARPDRRELLRRRSSARPRASRRPPPARSRAASSRNNAKGTVTFHLTKPDGEFLQQLAVPLASIVPAATPPKDQGDKSVPGTGPVHDQVVRPEPHDHARAQPVLQAVVEGRAARRLPRHDHRALRPHRRGRGDAGRERPGRLDRLLDPVRPAQRDRDRSTRSSSS